MAKLNPPFSERDHIEGRPDGPVTLVEYGDYECPHCGAAYPIVKELQRLLGKQLRFAFRNFPLAEIHLHAEHAAEAAESAGAQGKFWPMHDVIFENQDALEDEELVSHAAALKLDGRKVASDLANGTFAPRVREDLLSGVKSGVNGTPTFFINGVRHDGPWDRRALLAAIELAAARAR